MFGVLSQASAPVTWQTYWHYEKVAVLRGFQKLAAMSAKYKYEHVLVSLLHRAFHTFQITPSQQRQETPMRVKMFATLAALCFISTTTVAQSAQDLLDSVLNPDPRSATYASYSSEIYYNATLYNETPIASTNYDKLEQSAKLRLTPEAYDYAAGGAGLERTVSANRAAFDKVGWICVFDERIDADSRSSGTLSHK